jgi:hypothetical protein
MLISDGQYSTLRAVFPLYPLKSYGSVWNSLAINGERSSLTPRHRLLEPLESRLAVCLRPAALVRAICLHASRCALYATALSSGFVAIGDAERIRADRAPAASGQTVHSKQGGGARRVRRPTRPDESGVRAYKASSRPCKHSSLAYYASSRACKPSSHAHNPSSRACNKASPRLEPTSRASHAHRDRRGAASLATEGVPSSSHPFPRQGRRLRSAANPPRRAGGGSRSPAMRVCTPANTLCTLAKSLHTPATMAFSPSGRALVRVRKPLAAARTTLLRPFGGLGHRDETTKHA